MVGVVAQFIELTKDVVYTLPPYADELIFHGGTGTGQNTLQTSYDGGTSWTNVSGAVNISGGQKKVLDEPIPPLIKIDEGSSGSTGMKLFYRVSKR